MKTTKPEQIAVALYSVGKSIAEAMVENIPLGERPGVARELLDRLAHIQSVLPRNEHELIFKGAISAFGYRVDPDVESGLIDDETDEDVIL